MAKRKGISTGTTAERSIEEQGHLRFNTTTSLLEYYDGTSWKSIDAPPTVASVSPSSFVSDGSSTPTITITGSGFSNTIESVKFIGNDGTEYTSATVTRDSATQVTAQVTTAMTVANEPYDVKVTNSSGLATTLADALDAGGSPTFVTAAGSLGTIGDAARGSTTLSITITDPDSSGTISTSISDGSLPAGASISSAQTPGQTILSISGFSAVGSNTTSTFTIEATDGANTSSREYTITVNAPVSQSFTSSGTFSVPSGVTAVNVLVVAGGGGGGSNNSGGGGAGGLIYRPAFPVTPGGTVSVTVGNGGAGGCEPAPAAQAGQDSVFGTLTAKGGGYGAGYDTPGLPGLSPTSSAPGGPGGSGGGGMRDAPHTSLSTATQPTQPGDSGTYGFGNAGGGGGGNGECVGGASGGGGGGAGGVGGNGTMPGGNGVGGTGGIGRAYTIADGTTSVYYAGGGGGSGGDTNPTPGAGGQGGGGSGAGSQPGNGGNATANRGGGGGGGENATGGSGGKGIVIVAY